MECIVHHDAALTPHNPVDLTGQAWSMHSKLLQIMRFLSSFPATQEVSEIWGDYYLLCFAV